VEFAEYSKHRLWIGRLRQARETAQLTTDNGDFAPMTLELLLAGRHNQVGHLS
jgi:hypothetical protein